MKEQCGDDVESVAHGDGNLDIRQGGEIDAHGNIETGTHGDGNDDVSPENRVGESGSVAKIYGTGADLRCSFEPDSDYADAVPPSTDLDSNLSVKPD